MTTLSTKVKKLLGLLSKAKLKRSSVFFPSFSFDQLYKKNSLTSIKKSPYNKGLIF